MCEIKFSEADDTITSSNESIVNKHIYKEIIYFNIPPIYTYIHTYIHTYTHTHILFALPSDFADAE